MQHASFGSLRRGWWDSKGLENAIASMALIGDDVDQLQTVDDVVVTSM